MVYAVTAGGLCVSISFLLSSTQAIESPSENTTSASPAIVGCSLPAGPCAPPTVISTTPAVAPNSASQPTQSSRSPANSAAAAASSTGTVPTISAAWLTVVSASP